MLDWQIDDKEDSRLHGFHQLLITGEIPSTKHREGITHKVSTQLGMEKYGGSDSNIHALLDWLQLSGSLLADEIIQLVEQQTQGYEALDPTLFDQILAEATWARCRYH